MTTSIQSQFSSQSVEWYTPAKYIEAVRIVLDGIELDPASCAVANETVKAERYFTETTDGLSMSWIARSVFVNPPYGFRVGKSNQGLWSQKLIAEFEAGNVKSAILLVNASTSERWFKPLFRYPICFTDHRIRFDNAEPKKQPTKDNAFVYFGDSRQLFVDTFQPLGVCVMACQ
jgi:ParB family chromosome partitioning protein